MSNQIPIFKLKLATAFSGIGAIEHALKRMDIPFDILFASDNDPYVKKSYFANYEVDDSTWFDDVSDIKKPLTQKYRYEVDLLVGGTPCQSFSMVGKRRGLDDTRGTLFYDFARIIREIRPKIFIFENVKGLLNHDKGNTWCVMQKVFDDLGYTWFEDVLNAKDYGVPQNRERVFVIGFRKKRNFKFPLPVPLEVTMQDFLEDSYDSKFILPEKGINFVTSERNIRKRYTQIDGTVQLCQKRNQQFNWHGDFVLVPSEVDNKYFLSKKVENYVLASGTKNFYSKPKTDLDVARPLLSTMHKMHRSGVDNYITNGDRIRKLTPRECLRLMGFRDDFKQVVSDTRMYMHVGNSIVVDVLIHLLEAIGIENYIDNGEVY